jgi:hypothetical protein
VNYHLLAASASSACRMSGMSTFSMETVVCRVCHQRVAPTREGGTRPREHNTRTGPCSGPRTDYRLPDCDRCGGPADSPVNNCESPLFHPEMWTKIIDGRPVRVGNAAAAGLIVGVSGTQYQWLVRQPPPGPRRAPEHLGTERRGILRKDVRFYDLDAVAEYDPNRPGPGGHGGPVSGR